MEHINPKDGISHNDNGWHVFKQPSGRSIHAENIENLPDGYYDTQGRTEEYIRVYIDGEYGLSSAGTPVYKYFRPDYHMATSTLRPIVNGVRPLVVGMDLGLTPAAVIGQQDPRGRALVFDEAVSFDMGVQRFYAHRAQAAAVREILRGSRAHRNGPSGGAEGADRRAERGGHYQG